MNINYRLVRLAMLSFVLLIVDLRSFAQDGRIEIADVDPLEKDVSSVDGMIHAFYEIVSGPKGEMRDWSRDATLYIPEIRFNIVNFQTGQTTVASLTHQEFVENSDPWLTENGFFEHEIYRVTESYGSIVQVWSTYEFRYVADGPVMGRRINGIQLLNDGKRWWISSAFWQAESENVPIPAKYLPR